MEISNFLTSFESGLGTGLGLIVAIGIQNAYVLKQGILRNHPFIIALICASIDSFLIIIGVSGLGAIFSSNIVLLYIARFGGASFLVYYGTKSFLSAISEEKNSLLDLDKSVGRSDLKTTIMTVLALSLLNPHLYLDTCVLIGTIGSQFPEEQKYFFALGAITASFIWFFALSYGAAYLAPLFRSARAWKVMDSMIALMMWGVAGYLIIGIN